MRNLYIIGARGFGREVYNLYLKCRKNLQDVECVGFLDDNENALNGYTGYPPVVSSVEDYEPKENDVFVCALGDVRYKKKYVEMMLAKGGDFISLIHPDVEIGQNTIIGRGFIARTPCSISCDISIGDFVTVMGYSVLGHDCKVDDWSHLGAYSFLGGFSVLGKSVTLHPGARILPHKTVGDGAIVGAGSVVIRNVKNSTTVLGVPAKKLDI
ncbi:MAG: sialic acid O-acetyltransferase [Clostridia bacterium]|nr:sialic acid O-acetyltransferase [Clostridia bacterium]